MVFRVGREEGEMRWEIKFLGLDRPTYPIQVKLETFQKFDVGNGGGGEPKCMILELPFCPSLFGT